MPIPWLDSDNLKFPPIEKAFTLPNGLLAAGGDLRAERLIEAYREGIFPWYEEGQPILWWSPDPRMVLYPERLLISGSMTKFLRRQDYTVAMDLDFPAVVRACAAKRNNSEGTWITPAMQSAYQRLHKTGIAHSVEVRSMQGNLVGGLYGLAIGRLFFGESMFSRQPNTSKLALTFLVAQLKQWGFAAIDCQVSSAHLASLGAVEISRRDFQQLLLKYRDEPGRMGPWLTSINSRRLVDEL